ncbi:hypothetical protein KIN20_018317 [Parelaphostrongylus tenuis]|uniref:Uncharacterized protein n=1 Tax=Parelaphostrongylus tenuis TaxID=148309 RepID=A0AAD5N439_PARTN|nr:hypothetical protein KIN20_018317 [Parelaphostrongylus tenuis]
MKGHLALNWPVLNPVDHSVCPYWKKMFRLLAILDALKTALIGAWDEIEMVSRVKWITGATKVEKWSFSLAVQLRD